MSHSAVRWFSGMLAISVVILGPAPALAQLGDVTPPPITPPPVDLCPNIDGAQATIPTGMVLDGTGNCVTPDTVPPVISAVLEAGVTTIAANVTWVTNELSVSTFEYGTSPAYGSSVTLPLSAAIGGTAVLTGLSPNTTYYYCIHANDLANNASSSCGHSFSTAVPTSVPPSIPSPVQVIADVNPPLVSLITVTSITTTSALVTWTTDEVANGRVEYGTTAGYGSVAGADTDYTLTDSAELTNLLPNTLYHYRVRSVDAVPNETFSADNTFTTGAVVSGSVTPPETISTQPATVSFSSIDTTSISTSAATITWSTDLPSDSQVEYGVNSSFGSLTTLDTALVTSHSVTITGLVANTNYIFRVKSKPVGASVAIISSNHEFSTLQQSAPTTPPAISVVSSGTPSTSSATVTWTTDKNSTSLVQYGISTAYGELSTLNSSMVTSHSVALNNLEPATTYHFRVRSTDADGTSTSEDYTLISAAASIVSGGAVVPLSPPAAVSNLLVSTHDSTSATLGWNVGSTLADVDAEYDVRYSTTPINDSNFSAASRAQVSPILLTDLSANGTARSYTVAGLNPSTTYYFAVKSTYPTSVWSAVSNVPSITTSAPIVNPEIPNTVSSAVVGPTGVSVEGNNGQITLNWTNPTGPNFIRTVLVRKVRGYPTTPSDGQTIYEGLGETFTDTNLQNGTTYFYAIYSYDRAKEYSKPVDVSRAPSAFSGYRSISTQSPSTVRQNTQFSFPDAIVYGDTSLEVEHLQQLLAAQPALYPRKLVTGYFGSYTKSAIQKFQISQGMVATGVADHITTAALNALAPTDAVVMHIQETSSFDQDLHYGQTASDVEALQHFLIQDGDYKEAAISEYFGPLTRNAVITFQKKYSITPASGYVGIKTRVQIKKLLGL